MALADLDGKFWELQSGMFEQEVAIFLFTS